MCLSLVNLVHKDALTKEIHGDVFVILIHLRPIVTVRYTFRDQTYFLLLLYLLNFRVWWNRSLNCFIEIWNGFVNCFVDFGVCFYSPNENKKPRALSKLNDTSAWEKRKTKGKVAIQKMVVDLMELYLHRLKQRRPPYPMSPVVAEFAAKFPYEPTPDQKQVCYCKWCIFVEGDWLIYVFVWSSFNFKHQNIKAHMLILLVSILFMFWLFSYFISYKCMLL